MDPVSAFNEVFVQKPECRHKNKFFKCRDCSGNFCAKCIQLEMHLCPKLDERSKIEKENLSKKLVKIQSHKITLI